MLVEMPYFWGVINPKTYLNHDLGSKFFFLSSLAYKLVNLLVFEKNSCKMSKNWSFIKIIGLGLNFTYEFEVCYALPPQVHALPTSGQVLPEADGLPCQAPPQGGGHQVKAGDTLGYGLSLSWNTLAEMPALVC